MSGCVRCTCLDASEDACLGRPAKISLGVMRATAEGDGPGLLLKFPGEPASMLPFSKQL